MAPVSRIYVHGRVHDNLVPGGDGAPYRLRDVSFPVELDGADYNPSMRSQRVTLVGHFEQKPYFTFPARIVLVVERIEPAGFRITSEPPEMVALEGTLRSGIVWIGMSGPAYRAEGISFEAEFPPTFVPLTDQWVMAVGEFEVRHYTERADVLTFSATEIIKTRPEIDPGDPALTAAGADSGSGDAIAAGPNPEEMLGREELTVAAGRHVSGILPSLSEFILGSSGWAYHRRSSFVPTWETKVSLVGRPGEEVVSGVIRTFGERNFNSMQTVPGGHPFQMHLRMTEGRFRKEVDWPPEAAETEALEELHALVMGVVEQEQLTPAMERLESA